MNFKATGAANRPPQRLPPHPSSFHTKKVSLMTITRDLPHNSLRQKSSSRRKKPENLQIVVTEIFLLFNIMALKLPSTETFEALLVITAIEQG